MVPCFQLGGDSSISFASGGSDAAVFEWWFLVPKDVLSARRGAGSRHYPETERADRSELSR